VSEGECQCGCGGQHIAKTDFLPKERVTIAKAEIDAILVEMVMRKVFAEMDEGDFCGCHEGDMCGHYPKGVAHFIARYKDIHSAVMRGEPIPL